MIIQEDICQAFKVQAPIFNFALLLRGVKLIIPPFVIFFQQYC